MCTETLKPLTFTILGSFVSLGSSGVFENALLIKSEQIDLPLFRRSGQVKCSFWCSPTVNCLFIKQSDALIPESECEYKIKAPMPINASLLHKTKLLSRIKKPIIFSNTDYFFKLVLLVIS